MDEGGHFIISQLNLSLSLGLCIWPMTFTGVSSCTASPIGGQEGCREQNSLSHCSRTRLRSNLCPWRVDLCYREGSGCPSLALLLLPHSFQSSLWQPVGTLQGKIHEMWNSLGCPPPGVSHSHVSPHSASSNFSKLPLKLSTSICLQEFLFHGSRFPVRIWIFLSLLTTGWRLAVQT